MSPPSSRSALSSRYGEQSARRLWNAARKVAAGLPLGGEAVWPGLRNDLFVAHESIYAFASSWAGDLRVLDAACGTGYGSYLLARAGARKVVGVDRNPARIRFAARRFRSPGLSFQVGDCEGLDFPPDSFDLVVSSNTLEHLPDPSRFLQGVSKTISPGGQLLVAVPPVLSETDQREHGTNPNHVSNLSVRAWRDLLVREGWQCLYFSHRCAKPLDFHSFRVSSIAFEDFAFVEDGIEGAYRLPPITAIFRLRRAC